MFAFMLSSFGYFYDELALGMGIFSPTFIFELSELLQIYCTIGMLIPKVGNLQIRIGDSRDSFRSCRDSRLVLASLSAYVTALVLHYPLSITCKWRDKQTANRYV